jgi:predicted CXXCH cytochrome family protein
MSRVFFALSLLLIVAACGDHGAERFAGAAPSPEATYGSCAFCHRDLAETMTATGGHGSLDLKCQSCHGDLKTGFAECGHRNVPRCLDCHAAQITHHDPAVGGAQQCTHCHTAHGSTNLLLIREQLPLVGEGNMTAPCVGDADCPPSLACALPGGVCGTPRQTSGCAAEVTFTRLDGVADGGFASASRPGSGLCEVCHTTTRYYRNDGMGEPHFALPCFPCHPHTIGFLPR